jgi:hypothetical protein
MIGPRILAERLRGHGDHRVDEDAHTAAIAFLEERPVARIGERAAVDVRQKDDAVEPKLAQRAVELEKRCVRIIHRDRREALEARRMLRRQLGVGVVHQTRDLGLALRRREVHVRRREREHFDVDADAVHVVEPFARIGHRRSDTEEARAAVPDDRATGGIGAERERAADLADKPEEGLRVVVGVQVPAHGR